MVYSSRSSSPFFRDHARISSSAPNRHVAPRGEIFPAWKQPSVIFLAWPRQESATFYNSFADLRVPENKRDVCNCKNWDVGGLRPRCVRIDGGEITGNRFNNSVCECVRQARAWKKYALSVDMQTSWYSWHRVRWKRATRWPNDGAHCMFIRVLRHSGTFVTCVLRVSHSGCDFVRRRLHRGALIYKW